MMKLRYKTWYWGKYVRWTGSTWVDQDGKPYPASQVQESLMEEYIDELHAKPAPLTRWDRFLRLKSHHFVGKTFARLNQGDIEFVKQFISKFDESDRTGFAHAVNRLFVDTGEKPANHRHIWALLSNLSSEEFNKWERKIDTMAQADEQS